MIPLVRAALVIGAIFYLSPVRTSPVEWPTSQAVRMPEPQELSRLGQSLDAAASMLAATGWLNGVWEGLQRSLADLNRAPPAADEPRPSTPPRPAEPRPNGR